MSLTRKFGTEHNLPWNLGGMTGEEFEDCIFGMLTLYFKRERHLYSDVFIQQTPRKNDKGKDIVLKFTCETLDLFGITVSRKENREASVYIECKSTNSDRRLAKEKYLHSVDNGSHDNIDYYMLVTNSKLLPKDYRDAETLLVSRNICFLLVDQYLLAKFIHQNNIPFKADVPLFKKTKNQDNLYIEYQIDTDENTSDICFNFRNYSDHVQMYTISLVTDINWYTVEKTFSFTIHPNRACAKTLRLVYGSKNDNHELAFQIQSGNFETRMEIRGADVRERYTPPFAGAEHKRICASLRDSLTNAADEKLYCLWGMAGIGKTRIVKELSKTLSGGNICFHECTLGSKDSITNAMKEIRKFLVAQRFLPKDDSADSNDLYGMVSHCNDMIREAVILIDDFHNATSELIEQVKKLHRHAFPVSIILCGRTDYTWGDYNYYSFAQWTYDHLTHGKNVWEVKPLQPKETQDFVRAIIKGIPDAALETICQNSDNNPLYILQFIEYMLDEKIVHIINRDTIGILNPAKFQSHDYLPNDIRDIYTRRITCLMDASEKDGENYLGFLLLLAFFGGQIDAKLAEDSIDPDGILLTFLCERSYISRQNHIYSFYHESLKIYTQDILNKSQSYKAAVAQHIFSLPEQVLSSLALFDRGRLYLWHGDLEKATEIFEPVIREISRMGNISNMDIDTSTHEYFDDILDILHENPAAHDLISRAIKGKIYIILHHFAPLNAVEECDKYLSYMKNSAILRNDMQLSCSVRVLKAHALLNSGMNLKGELVLKELQSNWLIAKKSFPKDAEFDMLDRLCAIYVKDNCYEMACDYNSLEIKTAERIGDTSLAIIAYRTRSKLFYLNDRDKCRESLDMADRLLAETPMPRIQLNNDITRVIAELTNDEDASTDGMIARAEELVAKASEQNLRRADIQSNMVLAAAYLKRGSDEDIRKSRICVKKAINYSVNFGIPSYMWQLYNLLAIIDTKLHKDNDVIKQSFEMVFDILNRQNLLYIGRDTLCYSNVLAISNIGFFLRRHSFQNAFNAKMSMLTYCEAGRETDMFAMKNQQLPESELSAIYRKAKDGKILFTAADSSKLLRDTETGYFIALT